MANDILVGSTGFVGGNLMARHTFGTVCHSSDIHTAFDTPHSLVVYAGVPSAMFLANQDPEADLEVMRTARENLRRLQPEKAVLISSITVYADSRGKDEESALTPQGLAAYGANRLQLENWVREDFPDALIIRLPALYGLGLKKNFLYDLHTITPALLRPAKYQELSEKSPAVRLGYEDAGNGFYKQSGKVSKEELKAFFAGNDFNALAFTDSRSRYQFYDLGRLWQDMETALAAGLTTLNLTTPPVTAGEVYRYVTGKDWENHLPAQPFDYDLRSRHAALLGGTEGYLCTKEQELESIRGFLQNWK